MSRIRKALTGVVFIGLIAALATPPAEARGSNGSRPSYSGSKHSSSHSGKYAGGRGSSHKGGKYKNARSGNQYGKHKN